MSLKKFRIKNGMTQEQLARLLNISLRTYQNIERKNNTTVKIAKNIAVLLGGTIEEIFKEEDCK